LVARLKTALGDKVKDVRVSRRLTTSPSCLVADTQDIGANLERLLKAAGQHVNDTQPVLEINPDHPLVVRISNEESVDVFADWAHILFDQAVLSEGGQLDDSANFVQRLNNMLLKLSA
ncbi:MAG: molecular chaperone HtpG, partial [Gammaproteobacteria bacterium]